MEGVLMRQPHQEGEVLVTMEFVTKIVKRGQSLEHISSQDVYSIYSLSNKPEVSNC